MDEESINVYTEYSLILRNSFSERIRWINEFGGLNGCSLVLNINKSINRWQINKNSVYTPS